MRVWGHNTENSGTFSMVVLKMGTTNTYYWYINLQWLHGLFWTSLKRGHLDFSRGLTQCCLDNIISGMIGSRKKGIWWERPCHFFCVEHLLPPLGAYWFWREQTQKTILPGGRTLWGSFLLLTFSHHNLPASKQTKTKFQDFLEYFEAKPCLCGLRGNPYFSTSLPLTGLKAKLLGGSHTHFGMSPHTCEWFKGKNCPVFVLRAQHTCTHYSMAFDQGKEYKRDFKDLHFACLLDAHESLLPCEKQCSQPSLKPSCLKVSFMGYFSWGLLECFFLVLYFICEFGMRIYVL